MMKRALFFIPVCALFVFSFTGAELAHCADVCEDFESGFTLGNMVGTHADWFDGGNGPVVNSGIGVNSSNGLAPGNNIFTWVAHPFDWTAANFVAFKVQMDFQTDGSGHLDDDRIGWMIADDNVSSSNIFGLQCDPGGSGYCIEGYWDGVSADDKRPHIVDLPTLTANTFYRFRAEITKLTDTTATIDVMLIELNASGDSVGVAASGSIANTATLGDDEPNTKYFTGPIWPAFKNYTAAGANADNACYEVITSGPPQYTLTVNTVGSGSVTLDPPGGTYDPDTDVELTATPDSGWTFTAWSGDLTGSANPDTVTMTGNLTVTATFTGGPSGGAVCEDFESGYTLGNTVGTHADWYDGGSGPVVNSGLGVASSVGLAPASAIFTWTAHPFDWNAADFVAFKVQMDFQTDASGHLDDDRIGWMITDNSTSSSNIFGLQCDPGGSGYCIEGYWDGVFAADKRPHIVDLPTLTANTFYRFRAEITKLTATSASIDVILIELNASGDSVGVAASGSIANTAALGDDEPHSKYFTASTVWPAFKNYTAAGANADNACHEVITGVAQYSLTVNVVGNGTVALDPPGGLYDPDTEVELTANPDSNWAFNGWSGDLTGSANPDTITMDGHKTVTATFIDTTKYTLTVNVVGNGSVTLDPPAGPYLTGTEVELTADADPGWYFSAWSGDLTGSANPDTITMDGDKNVTATFNELQVLNPGDVIISAFQSWNSVGSQNPAEFVELFNTTDQTISLENMELISRTDNNSDGNLEIDWELSVDLTGATIAPHSFFLIAESGVAAPSSVHDVETDMDLATGEGGVAERAIGIQLLIDGQHMDHVLYGRHDGSDTGANPDGDVAWSSFPRFEVIRNTRGTTSFQEGLVSRETAADLHAGYDVLGYYTDEDALGDGYPNGVWYSPHDDTYDGYQARNSVSDSIPPPGPQYTLTVNVVGGGSVLLNPPGGTYNEDSDVELMAIPDLGWAFSAWSGDLSGSANPDTITMDGDKNVTATFVGKENSSVTCEDFESGFTLGATVGSHADWFDDGGGPVVNSGIGVAGSNGLEAANNIFIWTAHPFDWTAGGFLGYSAQMDFKTDGSGHLDDDRIGWMITDDDVGSSNIFGLQCDPGGDGPSGYNIEGYWDGDSPDKRPSIVNLPTLLANTFYRFRATITKLTDTTATIDVMLMELDASGDPVSLVASGSIANTADLGADEPNAKYFTGPIWPAYKNYTAAGAPADNACHELIIEPPTAVELVSFEAAAGDGQVILTWRTAAEVNSHSFNIYRDSQKIVSLPAFGDAHEYIYVDRRVTNGDTYAYQLSDVDLDGTETVHQVVCSATPTAMPVTYSLSQNYPNPFNPATEIRYALPVQTHVTMKVYNLLGQEIITLVDETKSAGRHTVSWNAANNASGIYFYRLETEEFSATKKMVFMK